MRAKVENCSAKQSFEVTKDPSLYTPPWVFLLNLAHDFVEPDQCEALDLAGSEVTGKIRVMLRPKNKQTLLVRAAECMVYCTVNCAHRTQLKKNHW